MNFLSALRPKQKPPVAQPGLGGALAGSSGTPAAVNNNTGLARLQRVAAPEVTGAKPWQLALAAGLMRFGGNTNATSDVLSMNEARIKAARTEAEKEARAAANERLLAISRHHRVAREGRDGAPPETTEVYNPEEVLSAMASADAAGLESAGFRDILKHRMAAPTADLAYREARRFDEEEPSSTPEGFPSREAGMMTPRYGANPGGYQANATEGYDAALFRPAGGDDVAGDPERVLLAQAGKPAAYQGVTPRAAAAPVLSPGAPGRVSSRSGDGGRADRVWNAAIQQESSGRPGVLGPPTRYGRAQGLTQMLPATAREMAGKRGLPWRPELMTGTTPEAAQYQERLGRAYFDEGLRKYGGDPAKALAYYHSGPNERLWGPKTQAHVNAVFGRVRGDGNE